MKKVVDHSRTQFNKPVYNELFYSFSKDCGFIHKSCLVYRSRTKGKIEVVAKIMDRLKVYDYEFLPEEEHNGIVNKLREDINNEVQTTTNEKPFERFQKEKEIFIKRIRYPLKEINNYECNNFIEYVLNGAVSKTDCENVLKEEEYYPYYLYENYSYCFLTDQEYKEIKKIPDFINCILNNRPIIWYWSINLKKE